MASQENLMSSLVPIGTQCTLCRTHKGLVWERTWKKVMNEFEIDTENNLLETEKNSLIRQISTAPRVENNLGTL